MAYQVVWSIKAVEDIDAIATYIARDSASYAAAVVQKILDVTQTLSQTPLQGNEIAAFSDPSLREQYAYCYRIIYRLEAETATIAAVVHGQKLLEITS
jgi:toxin ParE1/3/4